MDVISKHILFKKIKFVLVFFCVCCVLAACQTNTNTIDGLSVNYIGTQAISVSFDSPHKDSFKVVSKPHANSIVLGEFSAEQERVTFTPVIPFTAGIVYQIKEGEKVAGEFSIKTQLHVEKPQLVRIYPQLDTVPENLLKMYFVFSKPMQETRSALNFIKVINTQTQKEEAVFLHLETELWNADHTELTLWLDPGRIKKELIPNQKLGIPIKEGVRYELVIDESWNDAEGNSLEKSYTKSFVVGPRDGVHPTEKNWELTVPSSTTKEALGISFGDVLDAMLIEKNIQILDAKQQPVSGGFFIMKDGESALYVPKDPWKKGKYTLEIQSALEDLAGNTMNRLFDRDLHITSSEKETPTKTISFTVL
jgi:hypothetical protein